MFEVHSLSQADVLRAGEVTLAELGREATDRIKPTIASIQVITNVNPYQAQLLNRFTRGTILVAGQTMLVVEQSLNVAAALADRAVFMEKGRVRFEGPTRELLERDDLARAVFLGPAGDPSP